MGGVANVQAGLPQLLRVSRAGALLSLMGHSRPNRAGSKLAHVRYAPQSGSKLRH